ncbi:cache domain-containing sensor histidine kinase [Paenibacillus sp. IHBB 10380]|uniref:cache domain-containing sensor histidine kinase n=1 Tax=Paenibacillus sp. IHBB 10380 TaxID=1566358 RepID=UPI0005CFD11F|nr:sensor histidine kinase [Paenibacillus sp. IHBB 10380]AJS61242.1 histidine kinase [Paenibacillus sp. IHBB 10380]
MTAHKKEHHYIPFGIKLMITYSLFIIIPVLLVGYAANMIFTNSIQEQTREINHGTLEQMKDNISYRIEDMSRISGMLYFDSNLAFYLRHLEEGWVSYEATTKQLLPKIQTTIESANNKMRLAVYLHNDTLPEIYHNYNNSDPLKAEGPLFDLYHIARIKDRPWYMNYPKEKYGQTMQWKQVEGDAKFEHISLLRRLVDTNSPLALKEIGFIRISLRITDLLGSVDFQKIGNGTKIFALDESRKIMFSSGDTDYNLGETLSEKEIANYWVIDEVIPQLNWHLVALVPNDIMEQATSKVRLWTIFICLACYIIFSIAGLFVSRFYSRRVSKIVRVLDAFQEGNFQKSIHFKGKDEFTRISVALNEMGQNIDELIQELYMTNLKKKEAELESLQAQINPHFLYNTLSSISRLAKFGEVDKLQRMVLDLAKFYRLSLNEGRTVIPIKNELEQINAYINIQKTKFGDSLQVMFDVESDIIRYQTVKLILQPFIENALEHAWYGDRINIRIIGRLEGELITFRIIDDGIGIHPEILRQLFDPAESLNVGFGIRNVDERIKLHFGPEYGVKIVSKRGMGTSVNITILAQKKDKPSGRLS